MEDKVRRHTHLLRVMTTRSPRSFPRYIAICSPPHSKMFSIGIIDMKHTMILCQGSPNRPTKRRRTCKSDLVGPPALGVHEMTSPCDRHYYEYHVDPCRSCVKWFALRANNIKGHLQDALNTLCRLCHHPTFILFFPLNRSQNFLYAFSTFTSTSLSPILFSNPIVVSSLSGLPTDGRADVLRSSANPAVGGLAAASTVKPRSAWSIERRVTTGCPP